MSDQVLIIFLRNPELGRVKTRIAKVLGDEAALAIYLRLLTKLRHSLRNGPFDIHLYYSDYADTEDDWNELKVSRYVQRGDDLGSRMADAFKRSVESGYKKAVLIGSDIPDLSMKDLNEAFEALDHHDVVIGPAVDGGYYLVGMKKNYPGIFQLTKWSHSGVLQETAEKIKNLGLSLAKTRLLNDIDEPEDLRDHGLI